MSREEQMELISQICANIRESIQADIIAGKVPEEWGGVELQELVSRRVHDMGGYKLMGMKRLDAFENTLIVNNL